MNSLNTMLDALKRSIEDQKADGQLLEDLVREHAASAFPTWEIARCWRWADWPGRAGRGLPLADDGIDLVAETVAGRTVAIQCKARSGSGRVTPGDVQKFRGATAKHYDEAWIVTTSELGSGVLSMLERTDVVWKNVLDEATAAASAGAGGDGADPRTAMQDEAVRRCVAALTRPQADLAEHWAEESAGVRALEGVTPISRARLILPCGTGKTRTAARIVDELAGDGDVAVILTPSISLVGQTRAAVLEQLRRAGRTVASIVVCSDRTAAHVGENEHAAAEADDGRRTAADPTTDTGQIRAAELGCHAASDGAEVAGWLSRAPGRETRLNLVVGTYQSAHHVAEGLRGAGAAARILVCDEAHRTAQIRRPKGKKNEERVGNFTCCHYQDRLPAQYRLYLTATPRVFPFDNRKVQQAREKDYAVLSMDDEKTFGAEGYRKSYPAAVAADLLSDYRIIAFTTNRDTWRTAEKIARRHGDRNLRVTEAVTWLTYGIVLYGGAVEGGERIDVRSSIAFLNRTERSRALAAWLTSDAGKREIFEYLKRRGVEPRTDDAAVDHLDANNSATARRTALARLGSATAGQPHGICNVGIFGEGTDTPSLSAVAMLTPRRSPTDVIQIVGRCMRRDPSKTTGYVVIPVPLPRDVDAETSLGMETLDEAWKPLGQILSALRAHDGRIEDHIDSLLTICEPAEDPNEPPRKIHVPVVVKDGPVYRRGIWTGTKTSGVEEKIAEADCGKYTGERNDVRTFLTPELGFQWAPDATRSTQAPPADLTGRPESDERLVDDAPLAVAVDRTRRKDPRIATFRPAGRKGNGETDDAEGAAGGNTGIAETIGEAMKRIRSNRTRLPRRRGQEGGAPRVEEPRLWKTLAAHDLAVEVVEKSGLRGNETRDFNILQEPLRAAARSLRAEGLELELRALLRMPEAPADAAARDRKSADACMVSAILMLNAVMLHARLEKTGGPIRELLGSGTLESVLRADNPLARLAEAWVSIMSHDYQALFRPALRVVKHLRDCERRYAGQAAARRLAAWGRENAEHYTGMNMEYAGELFARVMGQQQADGAYFTRPEAARLLAELAADAVDVDDWADPGEWTKLKAADLACGSGTLLNAWIEACKGRVRAAAGGGALVRKFHRKAVEELVVGLDVNPVTLQMAAGRFLIGDTGLDYRNMNLFEMEHGPGGGGQVRLGTLELLGEDEIIGKKPDEFDWEDDDVVNPAVKNALKDTRVVIMNPPFSSNRARNTNQDAATKRAFQQREMMLRDRVAATDPDAGAVIDANSIRTFFTPLADAILSEAPAGVLAKVIPMTGLTGASGRDERKLLASRFQIRHIVMCHDPKNIHVSQDTGINEALLIGRRTADGRGTTEPTTFVNLRRFPKSVDDAAAIAQAIRNEDWSEIGTACKWPAEQMQAGNWGAVQWYEPTLTEAAAEISEDERLTNAGTAFEFGPPGQRTNDSFEPVPVSEETPNDIPMFNSIEQAGRACLTGKGNGRYRQRPTERQPRKMSPKLFNKYLKSMAHTLVATRFSTTSSRTTAQFSERPALGTAYIPVKTASIAEAKALNLLWNSTPVLLQLLNMRSKKATYPKWSVDQLSSVRIPAIAGAADRLAAVHDRLQHDELSRLRDADTCPVRAEIDAAVAPLFGLDPAVVANWRRLLAREPLMHNEMPEETYEEESCRIKENS